MPSFSWETTLSCSLTMPAPAATTANATNTAEQRRMDALQLTSQQTGHPPVWAPVLKAVPGTAAIPPQHHRDAQQGGCSRPLRVKVLHNGQRVPGCRKERAKGWLSGCCCCCRSPSFLESGNHCQQKHTATKQPKAWQKAPTMTAWHGAKHVCTQRSIA